MCARVAPTQNRAMSGGSGYTVDGASGLSKFDKVSLAALHIKYEPLLCEYCSV